MAFALQSQPRIHELSRSCAPKFYSGLKLQSPCTVAVSKPSPSAELFSRVHQSLKSRTKNRGHGQITMMPIGVPRVPYRNVREGSWQWLDLYNALYRERIIMISQYMDEEYSNQILATMLYLDLVNDSEKMYFYLNGQGGDLTPSLAIYDTMKSLRSPIGTHNMSHAFNLGAFLLSAGDKGYRSGMPLSRVTLRPPEGTVRGQADDVRNEAAELLRIRDYLFNELAKNTGQPIETIFKDLDRRKRLTAQESVEYGIIDKVVRPAVIKPNATRDGNAGLG